MFEGWICTRSMVIIIIITITIIIIVMIVIILAGGIEVASVIPVTRVTMVGG